MRGAASQGPMQSVRRQWKQMILPIAAFVATMHGG
jgi:hypothetical protein